MTLYRNFFLAAGAIAISYVTLKFFKIQKKKAPGRNKESEEEEEEEKEAYKEEIKADEEIEEAVKKKIEVNTKEKQVTESKNKEATAIASENLEQKKQFKKKIYKKDKDMQYLRPKPNFFIGFQIYEAGIHQKVQKLQEQIIAKNPKLHSALIKVSTLHVTLAITHLANESDIKSIKEKLDEWAAANVASFFQEPLTLSFTGIKTFRNVVAYVDIEPSGNREKLLTLSENINKVLSSAGFPIEKRDFKPHMTILKLSQNYRLLRAKKSFHDDFEFLKNCKEHFGEQEIRSIQLLSMNEPKDENGYYKCFHQIFVAGPKIESSQNDSYSPTPKHIKLSSQNDQKIPPIGFKSES